MPRRRVVFAVLVAIAGLSVHRHRVHRHTLDRPHRHLHGRRWGGVEAEVGVGRPLQGEARRDPGAHLHHRVHDRRAGGHHRGLRDQDVQRDGAAAADPARARPVVRLQGGQRLAQAKRGQPGVRAREGPHHGAGGRGQRWQGRLFGDVQAAVQGRLCPGHPRQARQAGDSRQAARTPATPAKPATHSRDSGQARHSRDSRHPGRAAVGRRHLRLGAGGRRGRVQLRRTARPGQVDRLQRAGQRGQGHAKREPGHGRRQRGHDHRHVGRHHGRD